MVALHYWRRPDQGHPSSDGVSRDTRQEPDWVDLPSLPPDVSLVLGASDAHSTPGHTHFYRKLVPKQGT